MAVPQSTGTTHLVVPYFDDSRAHLEPLPALSPSNLSRTTIKRRNSQYGSSTSSLSSKRPRIFSSDEEEEHLCQSPDSISPELPPRSVKRSRSNESISTLSSCSSDDPKTPRMQINDRDFESDLDILADPLDLSSPTLHIPSATNRLKHQHHQRHLSIPPRSDESATLDDFLGNLVRNADIIKQNAQALRTALRYERSCGLKDAHVNGKPCICRANTGLSVLNQYKRRQRELTLPLLETLVEPRDEVVRVMVPVIKVEGEEESADDEL